MFNFDYDFWKGVLQLILAAIILYTTYLNFWAFVQ